ncbi:hypothetical protein F4823DRAFT_175357 [Ustulina deusta]|nr:hypothetical protein F4823DRAFT_175357 [Ustulina deusta]
MQFFFNSTRMLAKEWLMTSIRNAVFLVFLMFSVRKATKWLSPLISSHSFLTHTTSPCESIRFYKIRRESGI